MIDNQGAQAAVGNIFDFVLIASERVKEIRRERTENGTYSLSPKESEKLEKPHLQACREIVEGVVGREYLKKVGRSSPRARNKMR